MSKLKLVGVSMLMVILTITSVACTQTLVDSKEEGQQIAEEFVKTEATFRFDGIPETLELTNIASIANGWQYIIEFDSQHAGYGDRSGQILAQVITHHAAEVTVQAGLVTAAVMDGVWDMVKQQMVDKFEIGLAPIDEVNVYFMESFPVQVGVHIKGGLPDGCTKFHDIEIAQEGNTINIKVTTQRPRGVDCTAVYTFFEKDINLGSDFTVGTTYTLNVNDYTTTFEYY
jgi:hypothetical protein